MVYPQYIVIITVLFTCEQGVMMVYDITDEATFNHIGKLINEVKEVSVQCLFVQ